MTRPKVVVVGNGMVGHKVLEVLLERGATTDWDIVVFGEERRLAYDRVGMSSFFSGTTAEELSLVAPGTYDRIELHLGDPIASIDRDAGKVTIGWWHGRRLRGVDTRHRVVPVRASGAGP